MSATAQKKAARAGVAQRYREHNNDQQRLYVCACCGERNKEDTGKYTRVQLSALRYKWGRALTRQCPREGKGGPRVQRSHTQ